MTLVDIGNESLETPDPDVVLSVRDLKVQFPTEDGVVRAVRGVSYDLHAGEVLGIVGESGSGKSVTSLTIMGLLPRSAQVSGSIRFGKTELVGAPEKRLNEIRGKNIAMIFQDPMTSLNPVYSIGYQIAEAVRAHGGVTKSSALDRAVELLDIVGIPRARERIDNYPHEFSGGMRQRVVIAIAMANNPDVIIADEPTTALDVTVQAQVLEALGRAREATGAAMILITHDLGVVAGQADRVLVMYAGRPVEVAPVDDVYYRPRMPYTLGLLGSMPRLDAATRQEKLTPIVGSPPSMLNLAEGCPFTPRCPLARELCERVEPDLLPTTGPDHLAACHFSAELEGTAADEVFEAGIADDVPAGPGPETRETL
ncbi:MAG: glutathione transport system ATP-binding protein [Frankiales bacterium]|jgi:oligopeptide/dipeptide ABC transporter ATP-binding protein|nr:glutathione transport system ATP-binding protein [Frankiales bacterium]